MHLDHLQRQAGAQVGTGALHHAEQPGQVVHHLAATAVALVVDRRKVVLEIDAGADRTRPPAASLQARGRRHRQRIVGDQENAAIEERSAAHRTAADERRGDGRVPEFGAGLRDVVPPVSEMLLRL
jgi:hypothetical protein